MEKSLPPLTPGTLYLVATPIGNLEDITLRALRTLKECDAVAAEDTRHTGQLLKHFGITRPLLSCFRFNEARRSQEIIARLGRGEKVALVTDAGSPGISDPGERVVKAVLSAGYRVEPVPGACALVTALTASGLPTDEFHFIGFLPHKPAQRRNRLQALKSVPGTLVLYESPYRVGKRLTYTVSFSNFPTAAHVELLVAGRGRCVHRRRHRAAPGRRGLRRDEGLRDAGRLGAVSNGAGGRRGCRHRGSRA